MATVCAAVVPAGGHRVPRRQEGDCARLSGKCGEGKAGHQAGARAAGSAHAGGASMCGSLAGLGCQQCVWLRGVCACCHTRCVLRGVRTLQEGPVTIFRTTRPAMDQPKGNSDECSSEPGMQLFIMQVCTCVWRCCTADAGGGCCSPGG